jgi:RNA polymerase sigma-70 factor (ECF subfamily)
MSLESDELIPTRATLIQRLKNWDDQKSWQEFFDTYWKLIYGVAIKGGLTKTEAQDAVQETMLGVAKHMADFNYDPAVGSFKGWLLNLTRWRITDQIRKRKKIFGHESLTGEVATETHPVNNLVDPASSQLDALWDAEWEKNRLDAAMAKVKRRLDPAKFQIFDFYVNKNWEPQKVAQAFNVSVDQVYLAKFRVTEMLSNEVKRIDAGLR